MVLDAACLIVFVLIGRASHGEGETAGGIATTAWPFLCGLLAGWLAARAWLRPAASLRSGVVVWLATVVVGMALRAVSGQGVAVAFVIVALLFLGALLVGWRALALRRAHA
jgi:peptidoglycan/LPS O-acetylase OafA/YrhL